MNLENCIKDFINSNKVKFYIGEEQLNNEKVILQYNQIKGFLLSNYSPGDIIALCIQKNYLYVLAILAAAEVGFTFIPMGDKWPVQRIKQIHNLTQFNVILTDKPLNGFTDSDIYDLTEILENKEISPAKESLIEISEEQLLYIIFTSGSTGEPKGVMIRRSSFLNFTQWVNKYFENISEEDRLLNTADFTFDLSMLDIALLLSKKPHFYISDFNSNIFQLLIEIEKYTITLMATVPNNINMLLSKGVYEKGNISSLKHLLIGGARFSFGLYNKIKQILPHSYLHNLYGPTEATVYCSVKRILFDEKKDVNDHNISVGKAIANCTLKILKGNGREARFNEKGELYIGGIQLMQGYVGNKELTKKVLCKIKDDLYYKTGDEAFFNEKGNLFIVGRNDDTIKCEGYRINLSDIDSYVQKLDYVDECATIGIPDEAKENFLVLYVCTKSSKNKQEIQNDLKNILTEYQIPKQVELVESLPLNSSGKISKKTLVEKFFRENKRKKQIV